MGNVLVLSLHSPKRILTPTSPTTRSQRRKTVSVCLDFTYLNNAIELIDDFTDDPAADLFMIIDASFPPMGIV